MAKAQNGDFVRVEGFVEFPPQERQAGDKLVKNVTIRTKGDEELLSLTLWPQHIHADVAKGDYVFARGKFSERTVQKQDGTQATYKGVSVKDIAIVQGIRPQDEAESGDAW